MNQGNRQLYNYAGFLLLVIIATSVSYHWFKRDHVSLTRAERRFHRGELAAALPLYEKLAAKGFRPDRVPERLADCYFAAGRPDDARKVLYDLLAAATDIAETAALSRLADTTFKLGLYQDAIHKYSNLLARNPQDRASRLSYARALAWIGNFEEAVVQYRIILGESQ